MIEGEHSLIGERRHELNGKVRIATRFLVDQLRERRSALRPAVKSVCNQLLQMLSGERGKRNLQQYELWRTH